MFKNFTSHVIKITSANGFTIEIAPEGIVIDIGYVKNLLGDMIPVPMSHNMNGDVVPFPDDDHDIWFVENQKTAELMARDGDRVIGMMFSA